MNLTPISKSHGYSTKNNDDSHKYSHTLALSLISNIATHSQHIPSIYTKYYLNNKLIPNIYYLLSINDTQISQLTDKNYKQILNLLKHHEYKSAFLFVEQLAKTGTSWAMNSLGYFYMMGIGVTQQKDLAFKWCNMAVLLDFKAAKTNLALCYANGFGVRIDHKQAISLFEEASWLRDPNAAHELGNHYFNGVGVKLDIYRAIGLYQEAAIIGNPRSMYKLGIIYALEKGVTINKPEALQLLIQAASLSHPLAMHQLSHFYTTGLLGEIDYAKAFSWSQKLLTNLNDLQWNLIDLHTNLDVIKTDISRLNTDLWNTNKILKHIKQSYSVKYNALPTEVQQNNAVCNICFEEFTENKEVISLFNDKRITTSVYDTECLIAWGKKSATNPLTRNPIEIASYPHSN